MKVGDAIGLVMTGLVNYGNLLAAAQKAQAEGREELNEEELAQFRARDDESSRRLQAEIDKQRAEKGAPEAT